MDFSLTAITDMIPDDIDIPEKLTEGFALVKEMLPDEFHLPEDIAIPAEVDLGSVLPFILVFAAASLILGVLGRVILGKRSSLNHSVSAAMGILLIYVVTVVIYTFKPTNLTELLSPLPFVNFTGEYMVLFPFRSAEFPIICAQVLSMVILAFLVNLLDSLIPKGESVIGWYLLRFVTVALAMVLHLIVTWASNTFLPDVLVTYAPVILLVILIATVLVGVITILLGLLVSTVNPILGGITAFLFNTLVGKQLTKAVFTTVLLTAVFYSLEHFGFTVIYIAQSALIAYIPLVAALLVLWYLLGHVL